MSRSSNVDSEASLDYPLQNNEATKMLADALEKTMKKKGWSQRTVAAKLNYKTSVVLSHMALGRVPIPIDRAPDMARLLDMDASRFLLAVLEQRHPDIDFQRLIGASAKRKSTGKDGRRSYVLDELEDIAGKPLDDLSTDKINVLREVVADPNATRRWLNLAELQTVEIIRKAMPDGLSPMQRQMLKDTLETM